MPPPPPPPGPPPPPMMAPGPPPSGGDGQQRNMLLSSIRAGTKLKKTVTNDKSGPHIAGKVSGGAESSREGSVSSGSSGSSGTIRMNGGGPPGLGGLFAGGMPKLKSTGLSIGAASTISRETPIRAPHPPESRNINRGPPPQPPPSINKPNFPPSASDSTVTNSPISNSNNNGFASPRPLLPNKPAGGYGKPNLAPKPPPPMAPNVSALHQNSGGGESSNRPAPSLKLNVNGRPAVSRAQSMRAPRTPPVAPPVPIANGPLVNQKGAIHLSQDGLHLTKNGTLPHNFQQSLKMAPSPPRGTPTRPPVSRPPPPPSRPAPPSTAPPPPPPHRSTPAPPPPRLPPAAPTSSPPAPPTRNSSMRNGNMSSLMSELESRFAFHNVMEFPDPERFQNLPKNYNTRVNANAKQQAPAPPLPAPTHLQLQSKMWTSHSSQC